MEEGPDAASRYWCHMCSQTVNPVIEVDTMKCPICQSGFVEEMSSGDDSPLGGPDPDRTLSMWAPILLGMMGSSHRRRHRPIEDENNENNHRSLDDEAESDRELESIIRRRRNAAAILHLLRDIRAGILSESGNSDAGDSRDGDRLTLINPFSHTIVVRGSYDPSNAGSQNHAPVGSLGDYFVGPGLDLLLQHLSENDPNTYGTPPARKEAVEALPDVKIVETAVQCAVCLDECEIGSEVKEMPCRHKFHGECILPWLELHSSCPVCRYRLPCDESEIDLEGSRNNNISSNEESSRDVDGDVGDGWYGSGREFSVPLLWPFNGLFSSSSDSRSSGGNSTANSTDGNSSGSRGDES
ncbi:hypothetical protein OROMI_010933 [Orobanche minor]